MFINCFVSTICTSFYPFGLIHLEVLCLYLVWYYPTYFLRKSEKQHQRTLYTTMLTNTTKIKVCTLYDNDIDDLFYILSGSGLGVLLELGQIGGRIRMQIYERIRMHYVIADNDGTLNIGLMYPWVLHGNQYKTSTCFGSDSF